MDDLRCFASLHANPLKLMVVIVLQTNDLFRILRFECCARLFANVIVAVRCLFSISLSIRDQNAMLVEGV
jgi:hypothetical protein